MVPVAVSVPSNVEITIEMQHDSWAFGKITGAPLEN